MKRVGQYEITQIPQTNPNNLRNPYNLSESAVQTMVKHYEKNRKMLDQMLQYACENSTPRSSSGLVEQQRLFMKMKDKRHV